MLIILTTHPIQYQVPLWQALARDGRIPFEVWFLTDHGVNTSFDREFGKSFSWDLPLLEGYSYKFLKVSRRASPGSFWKTRLAEPLGKRLKKVGAKAICVQGWQVAAYWQAVWQAHACSVPVWIRGESNDLAPKKYPKQLLKSFVMKRFFNRIKYFLYIGSANKRLYQGYGVREKQLLPAPYCVDNEFFAKKAETLKAESEKRSEIRKKWGIAEDALCILFCGKFIPKKRPLDLVRAATLLLEKTQSSILHLQFSSIHLLFVGSGELGAELRANCNVVFDAEANVHNGGESKFQLSESQFSAFSGMPKASFAGFLNQTEIPRAYVAADCLVLPSDFGETWGLVVNEAIACGLYCIVSDQCGSAWDLVGPESRFPCGNVEELADRICNFMRKGRQGTPQSVQCATFNNTIESIYRAYANPFLS